MYGRWLSVAAAGGALSLVQQQQRRLPARARSLCSSTALLSTSRCVASGSGGSRGSKKENGDGFGSGDAESRLPPSPWDPQRNRKGNAVFTQDNREAAQTRLTELFHKDTARRELRMMGATVTEVSGRDVVRNTGARHSLSDDQTAPAAHLVFEEDSLETVADMGDAGGFRELGRDDGTASLANTTTSRFLDGVDEDAADAAPGEGLIPQARRTENHLARTPKLTLEALEQELLDDDFSFFPPAVIDGEQQDALLDSSAVSDDVGSTGSREREDRRLQKAKDRYVPGQQIVPPGFTRYRVEVQYQGSDFDGWYKSSLRQWEVVERLPGGKTRRRPANPSESGDVRSGGAGVAGEAVQSRHHARTILEDALAVALDVPSVSVTAAVIPETGVSVRRLTCHVDLPSDIEMQPRTIIQRATMWLQSHQQPLAILACHPCKNQDFHARHSGVRRVYCYRILNRVAPPLFDAGFQWHVDRHLDVARMQRFAAAMEGTKDFGYFADPKMANALRRAAVSRTGTIQSAPAFSEEHEVPTVTGRAPWEKEPAPKAEIERGLSNLDRAAALPTYNAYGQKVVTYDAKPREYWKARTNLPTIRTIDKIAVERQEDEVLIWFVGQSFLRHQIRNMVSVLKASGHGLWDELELQHAFNSGFEVSRKAFKRERLPPAPAYGLTLWDVEYPRQHRDDYVSFVDAGPYEEVDISAVN